MLSGYIALIQKFIDRSITAGEFERLYLDLYQGDNEIHQEELFQVLETLFGAVDSYMGDLPVEDPETELDEAGLRKYATEALEGLIRIREQGGRN